MDFKKKVRIRLIVASIYAVIGLALIVASVLLNNNTEFLSSFGACLAAIGVLKIVKNIRLSRNGEAMKNQLILESDERNASISNKARAVAFNAFVLAGCIGLIVFSVLDMKNEMKVISGSICFVLLVYWISYIVLQRKN